MQITFYITEEKINSLTVEDYEAFERAQDGDSKIYRLRPALCKFMVDEDNNPLPLDEALKISGKLTMKEAKEFIEKFFETVKLAAVPKANRSPS